MSAATSDPARVRDYFVNFGAKQAPQNGSPLYEVLALGVADDPEMIAFAAQCPASQPSANLLLAAVHYLLLRGERHPLAAFYPDVCAPRPARPATGEAVALLREFVALHREPIAAMLRSRLVQTNVVRRTTCLLPAFGRLARTAGDRPLALIEIGASAGLNLLWDRYRHRYALPSGETFAWGPADARLELETEVRGATIPPQPGPKLRVAWRRGIDLSPVDVGDPDATLWLRALIFPEHLDRHREIEAALAIAGEEPPELLKGNAVDLLPEQLAAAPPDAALCVYATMVLNQLPAAAREQLQAGMEARSRERPVHFLAFDGNREGFAVLRATDFADGESRTRTLANAHAHGRWLEWTDRPSGARSGSED